MLIPKGALVRPNNPSLGIPLSTVWRVSATTGGLKLCPYNAEAREVPHLVAGLLFKPEDFNRQTLNAAGEWVDELPLPDEALTERMPSSSLSIKGLPTTLFANSDAVTAAKIAAEVAAEQVSLASAHCARLLKDARKLEAERRQALRKAQAAKAKADKEAAAKAKVGEAKRQLAARLHADRCLGEATLELIAEVARQNNGGEERRASTSIATHCDQLQPLARSYGYRIVKPSMVALVIKI